MANAAATRPAFSEPVTKKPEPCSLQGHYLSLTEAAYVLGRVFGNPITVAMVSGALRALQAYDNHSTIMARVRGVVIRKQQTMVHKSQLKPLESYLGAKFEGD